MILFAVKLVMIRAKLNFTLEMLLIYRHSGEYSCKRLKKGKEKEEYDGWEFCDELEKQNEFFSWDIIYMYVFAEKVII
jgi:hypothetical protein